VRLGRVQDKKMLEEELGFLDGIHFFLNSEDEGSQSSSVPIFQLFE